MLQNLTAITFRAIRYKDNRLIVDLYTKERGRISCNAIISPNHKNGSLKNTFQPLSIIEVFVEVRPNTNIYQLRNAKLLQPYHSIPFNPIKSAIVLFLADFFSSAIKEEAENKAMFDFISSSLIWLDESKQSIANFHLTFLLRLLRFLGLYPYLDGYEENCYFDMLNACFTSPTSPKTATYIIYKEEAKYIPLLMRMKYETMNHFHFSREQRQRCLELINQFYSLHLPDFPEHLRSIDVLKELFD